MRITSNMVSRSVLADLNRATEKLAHSQAKIASGKEITRASDDPFGTSRSLSLRESLESTRQYARNVDDGLGWQEATELAITRIGDVASRARELLLQGATDSISQGGRDAIAQEIDQLILASKEHANTSYNGRFLFSGTKTDVRPYEPTDDVYRGNAGVVAREIGPGVSLQVNVQGNTLLGDGTDGKLLDVLRDVSANLKAGNTVGLRDTDLKQLDVAIDDLTAVRAGGGARTNRLESAASRLDELEEATTKQLSETEDADMAQVIIDLNTQQAAYQAALRAGASIVQTSLMDFLR